MDSVREMMLQKVQCMMGRKQQTVLSATTPHPTLLTSHFNEIDINSVAFGRAVLLLFF